VCPLQSIFCFGAVNLCTDSESNYKMDIRFLLSPAVPMEKFPEEKITNFKYCLYNLLVDAYNFPRSNSYIATCSVVQDGVTRHGFRITNFDVASKKLAELYSLHVRKGNLEQEDQSCILTKDLYKFYLRACFVLISKYFEKVDKVTFLGNEVQFFVPGSSLQESEQRMKNMSRTPGNKRSKVNRPDKNDEYAVSDED